ncbi:MAG TPA: prolyl oligopeptidase family serine peptidase [Terriglobales bacterium]
MSGDITSLPSIAADERVRYGADASQFFDVWIPRERPVRGSAVMIHGGFWRARYDLLHASHLCGALAENGIAMANLEYRRVGNPGGGWPGSYEDVLAGFDAAKKFLPAAERLVVLGHSAGGHLALRLAVDRTEMRGVVALAPVACLKMAYELNLSNGAVMEFLGGTPDTKPEVYAAACPLLHSSGVGRALIHGTDDETVPVSLSREFVGARQNDRPAPRLAEVSNAGHFDLIDPRSKAFSTVLKTVEGMVDAAPGSAENG